MKIISFTVPCYNSQSYMKKCIDSLLPGGEDVEIIIVNDGSTDLTGQIADEYEKKYPSIVRVIHQENGGHGEGLNTGIKNAKGIYFKVVDSDDWVDYDAYMKILNLLKEKIKTGENPDLLVSNYVYEKQGAKHKKVMHLRRAIPKNKLVGWEQKFCFSYTQYILMHSAIYKTEVIKKSGVVLPKHTFYVDSIFVLAPIPYVNTIYYLDVDFYRYFIGRETQSVNEKVMIKRMDQQIRVNKELIRIYTDAEISNKNMDRCMRHYIDVIMCVASTFLLLTRTKEALEIKKDLWLHLKNTNPDLYKKLRKTTLGIVTNFPGKIGREFYLLGYKFFKKWLGFN